MNLEVRACRKLHQGGTFCHLVQIEQLSQKDVIWLKAVFKSRGYRSCSKDHRSQQNARVFNAIWSGNLSMRKIYQRCRLIFWSNLGLNSAPYETAKVHNK